MHPEKDTAEAFLLRRAAKTGVPITGSFELTPLCNLNCKMCYAAFRTTLYISSHLFPGIIICHECAFFRWSLSCYHNDIVKFIAV